MTNTLLTSDVILKEALFHLENELGISKVCNRDYEAPFANSAGIAGKPGDTIRIRKPVRGLIRTGSTMQVQDIAEGKTTIVVGTQIGADLQFSSQDLTLRVEDFGTRYLRPQMIKMANKIDTDVMQELVQHCPNWQGTPGNTINSFGDYALAPQRLDELSVPTNDRAGLLSPADYWGTVANLTTLSADAPVRSSLQRSKLGTFAGTETYMTQNIYTQTVGSWGTSPVLNTASGVQTTTYAAVMANNYSEQSINISGLTATTGTVNAGDVFTLSSVFAVNPITLATQSFLRQFVVITGATADASGNATISISPAIIPVTNTTPPTQGSQYATCSAAPASNAAITIKGTASTSYAQNVVLNPDAVTLAVVPLIKPQGAVKCETQTYKGISMRLITGYDITNDLTPWRFDLFYGFRAIQGALACRLSGTP